MAFVVSPEKEVPDGRLLVMLHGVCTPPSDVCGAWRQAAAASGTLVCPAGNATCGPEGSGGPTWEEPFAKVDEDVEEALEAVRRRTGKLPARSGAVIAGFSRGGYIAAFLAAEHPGRWPYLVVNEADVELSVPTLRRAGVRAVALIAGEWGTQLPGERKTVAALVAEGYPARLWVMPRVGHAYSPDIDAIMRAALDFVVTEGAEPAH